MFGRLEKLLYFCGVGEQTDGKELDKFFLKLFSEMLAYMKSFS